MKTTISLTGLPLLRETDPILSPAFAAIALQLAKL